MTIKDIKTIAKMVRKELKTSHPDAKFSVTIERYSGGQSLTVALMAASFEAIRNNSPHQQLNQYTIRRDTYEDYLGNGSFDNYKPTKMTEAAWKLMKSVDEIADRDNWNNSDSMIDYFDVNYYLHLAIGKWNKDFMVKTV